MLTPALEEQTARQRRIVSWLEKPRAQHTDEAIEVVETHLSWLFFTSQRVLKMKRPLCYEHLDYSTASLRRQHCEAEIALNRRLAPDVYVGLRRITEDDAHHLALDGAGTMLETLVEMRRLPEARNFEHLLAEGRVTEAMVDALADRLAAFYESLPPVPLAPERYIERLRGVIRFDIDTLRARRYRLDGSRLAAIGDALAKLVDSTTPLIETRVRGGRVVECHGDLRPEHIYFAPDPVAIDCLEFCRLLRTLDSLDELAFVAMECDRRGAGWVSRRLMRRYMENSGDAYPEPVYRLYMARRALLWAKLGVWHLDRDATADRERWVTRARDYIALVGEYLA